MVVKIADAIIFFSGDTTQLKKATKDARTAVNSSIRGLVSLGKTAAAGLAIAGAAVTGVFALSVREANKFNKALAEVNTLGIENLAELKKGVKDVGTAFGIDLGEVALGAYQAISATGLEAAETIQFLETAAFAAKAGVADLSSAVDLGAGTMNAFGGSLSSLESIFDEAFIAVKNGVTTFEQLSSTVGRVAPTFQAAGLASKDMFAAIAALTKGGLQTSRAVTGLQAALSNIIKPTSEAKELAAALGFEFNATALKAQGLESFLRDIQRATQGDVTVMAQLFGSVEGLNAVLTLAGAQSQAFSDILNDMSFSAGATQEAFEKFKEADTSFVFSQLKQQIKALATEIGDTLLPELEEMTEFAIEVVESLRTFVSENDTAIRTFVAKAGVLSRAALLALGGVAKKTVETHFATNKGMAEQSELDLSRFSGRALESAKRANIRIRQNIVEEQTRATEAANTALNEAAQEGADITEKSIEELLKDFNVFTAELVRLFEGMIAPLAAVGAKIGGAIAFEILANINDAIADFLGGGAFAVFDAAANFVTPGSGSFLGVGGGDDEPDNGPRDRARSSGNSSTTNLTATVHINGAGFDETRLSSVVSRELATLERLGRTGSGFEAATP